MEGPTPVSALIHAATMVTAGVFLLLKCSVILEFSSVSINLLLLIGGLTAFMSGTIGILQFDVKKVIAYSTCSQLGYMLLTAGFLNQNLALYHLTNHAFFKALLFSGAGCIIHSSLNEQDIRKFGSFSKLFRLIFMFFIIGSLALCGFIFLTGYYSKDFILESIIFIFNYFSVGVNVSLIIAFLTTTTIITSLYSVRLIHLTFINHPLYSYAALKMLKESSFVLTFPL
jgi:NADH:ubiquinone oxidoreductase subunit 5 (subunit L)/multisubunit Na+/H+ antiporter MnhA subunit